MKHQSSIRRILIPIVFATDPASAEAARGEEITIHGSKPAAPRRPLEHGRPKWPDADR